MEILKQMGLVTIFRELVGSPVCQSLCRGWDDPAGLPATGSVGWEGPSGPGGAEGSLQRAGRKFI